MAADVEGSDNGGRDWERHRLLVMNQLESAHTKLDNIHQKMEDIVESLTTRLIRQDVRHSERIADLGQRIAVAETNNKNLTKQVASRTALFWSFLVSVLSGVIVFFVTKK